MLAEFFAGERLRPVRYRVLAATGEAEPLILDEDFISMHQFELREEVGQPYSLSITIVTDDLQLEHDALVGGTFELEIHRPDQGERIIPGIIERAEYVRTFGKRLFIRLEVVPALSLLRHTRRRRIFQEQTVVEILRAVAEPLFTRYDRKIDDSRLTRSLVPRDYCVQMDESDLEFVCRILADEGIWFAFDVDSGVETMVLLDAVSSAVPAGGSILEDAGSDATLLPVIPRNPEDATVQSAHYFARSKKVATASVSARAWDWKANPPSVLETVALDEDDFALLGAAEPFNHRRLGEEQDGAGPHRDRSGDFAQLAIERAHSAAVRATGVSNAVGLAPGMRVEVTHHPHPELDGNYVLLRAVHRGSIEGARENAISSEGSYACEFECQADDVEIRPRALPRPRVAGPHTAIVVGPAGEEIHTDEHGRVRVRMHWDELRSDVDEPTAWLRVAQPWAGAGFGTMFLPRIGMEVIVSFVDGDPDRPMVTGCLYNGGNPPPVSLPDNKTQTTIKSQSSPGGDGFNEFRFEDAAGSEEVFLHAQRNLRETVRSCHTTSVGGKQTLTVGKDQQNTIKGEQSTWVEKRRDHTVNDDNLEIVNGTDEKEVHGTKKLMVTEEYVVNVTQKIVFQCGPSTRIELTPTGITINAPLTFGVQVGATTLDLTPLSIIARGAETQIHAATSTLVMGTSAELQSAVSTKCVSGASSLTLDGTATLEATTTTVSASVLTAIKSDAVCTMEGTVTTIDGKTSLVASGGATAEVKGGGANAVFAGGFVDLNG